MKHVLVALAILWVLCVPLLVSIAAVALAFGLRVAYTMYAFKLHAPAVGLSFEEAAMLVVDDAQKWVMRLFR